MAASHRIAVDAMLYRPGRGGVEAAVSCTARGIARAGFPRFEVDLIVSGSLAPFLGDCRDAIRNVKIHSMPCRFRMERIIRQQILARRDKYALLHHLGYVIPFAPLRDAKVVASVYDIISLTDPSLCTRLNRWYYGVHLP